MCTDRRRVQDAARRTSRAAGALLYNCGRQQTAGLLSPALARGSGGSELRGALAHVDVEVSEGARADGRADEDVWRVARQALVSVKHLQVQRASAEAEGERREAEGRGERGGGGTARN
jgi:hypothetical protein